MDDHTHSELTRTIALLQANRVIQTQKQAADAPVCNDITTSFAPKPVEVVSKVGVVPRETVGARIPLHRGRTTYHERVDVGR